MEHFEQKNDKNFSSVAHYIFKFNNIVPDKIPDKKDYQRKTMKISIFDIFFDIN